MYQGAPRGAVRMRRCSRGHPGRASAVKIMTPGQGGLLQSRTRHVGVKDTSAGALMGGTHLRDKDTYTRGHRMREHTSGSRTPLEEHVTYVTTGYLYQSYWMKGISPEPNSTSATLYLYLSTSPRLFSHLGFLFMNCYCNIVKQYSI